MIDRNFTKKVQEFLLLETRSDEQIIEGATLLLRINKNKALFQQVVRNPKRHEKKVIYELNKHLKYRLDGLTLNDVRKMDKKVTSDIDRMLDEGEPQTSDSDADQADTSKPKLGKRADHDNLPPEIQGLWDINAQRYKKIKEARATVETLEMPCDRYEYLKFMSEAYAAYKKDMAIYDNYKADTGDNVSHNDINISSVRAYISRNRKKYEELAKAEDKSDEINELHEKIQQRVDTLMENNAAISGELAEWLNANNFEFMYDESGHAPETDQ